MKPHIKLVRKGLWSCTGESITRNGVSPSQAYNRWHAIHGKAVQAAGTSVFKLPPPRVATPMTVRPDHIEAKAGAALLGYSESMVRRVAGALQTRPWVPPTALRINQARAAAHQPPMMSISSRAGDVR
ncbi:hypothetical protein GCM10007242_41360 [Pigmentiphaga litoralis]|uniref:hypothetical protein n=1 Tax=Pigmentiphaga litoralis TaxID=516702 RepID=UPI00167A54E4|nr:hypothetical protein [Pigmentiphaga litoralis]GGX30462.1 hypothetical protein GCM10007242_41360 [Pigmentiphaga litoralis]